MDRTAMLTEYIKKNDIFAALISKRENVTYFSGFTGSDAVLLITENSGYLLTDSRNTEQAQRQSRATKYSVIEIMDLYKDTAEKLLDIGNGDILFEDCNMTCHVYNILAEKSLKLKPAGTAVDRMRIIKDQTEIGFITRAQDITDKAFTYILGVIKPGITENDIRVELEYKMAQLGSECAAFETIIASGTNSSMPHAQSTDKRVECGDMITMDFGATVGGYRSDMTRTVALGKPSDEMIRIYNTVLEAQKRALEGLSAGCHGRAVDALARDVISTAGYAEHFGHGLGHGVGLEIHEAPRLSPRSEDIMAAGMVVTVEPGIYIPDTGGVRIEDLCVIAEDGCINLTNSTKELLVI